MSVVLTYLQTIVMFDISFLSLYVVCMRLCYATGEGVERAQTVMGLVEHETVIRLMQNRHVCH